ncbi:EF-hand domain-containing protein [Alteromonas sp. MMG017]|uniref:EF-hand domain-containing protein n=1 Tax=Alteromonas sp. MMG017 TaxID=2822692 RepID=UPI001B3A7215|nr:EF-hand domain-containing protein [Alteromonas sp. MMG017]MBQ4831362.1 EF-hand domain-containing protein [Alteromonas sp. MMG017]
MKKLTLAMVIGAVMSTSAFAAHHESRITSDFEALDANGDGMLSKEEVKGSITEETMSNIDSDGDAMINHSEFTAYIKAKPEKFADELVVKEKANHDDKADVIHHPMDEKEAMGTDGDVISEKNKELRTQMKTSASLESMNKTSAMAKKNSMGADGDVISEQNKEMRSEMKTSDTQQSMKHGDAMEETGAVISEKNKTLRTEVTDAANMRFDEADANKDGELSKREIENAGIKGDFMTMDKDGNELITRMEYRRYFEEIKTMGQ